jgi:hypothetical protein
MAIEIESSAVIFWPDDGGHSHKIQFGKGGATAVLSQSGVIIDNNPYPQVDRRIIKFDLLGHLKIDMFVKTLGNVTISDDDTWYALDGAERRCPSPIVRVWSSDIGDIAVLWPETAPDAGRNLYYFDGDGRLRWQIGKRDFRPNDPIIGAEWLSNGNVRAVASENGWSAEIDSVSGDFVRILERNLR